MSCPACHHDARPGARFCDACGTALAATCTACAHELRAGARFCDQCGTAAVAPRAAGAPAAQGAPASPAAGPGAAASPVGPAGVLAPGPAFPVDSVEVAGEVVPGPVVRLPPAALAIASEGGSAERKQVTVLFADVEGSMELAERLDPERWQEIMGRFFAIFCAVVDRYEGTVHQFVGDGAIAYFGAPVAHEDHARRACVAALELVDALKDFGREMREAEAIDFHVRSGLNSGSVVVGAVGADANAEYVAIGHTVGLAQRMQSLADPGTACVSEHTAALVRGTVDLRARGAFAVKGAREPVQVYELRGAHGRRDGDGAGREVPLVGRVIELALLDAALRRAAGGDGQVVALVGDAGVGKRRVIREFAGRAIDLGVATVRVEALAHERHVPSLNFQLLFHRFLGTSEDAPEGEQRAQIGAALVALDPKLSAELPLLLDVLGLGDGSSEADPTGRDTRRRRVARLFGRLLRARTRDEPLLVVIENLQWLDAASAERMADLVAAVEGARAMLVISSRPGRPLPWGQEGHVHVQRLGPLNPAEQRQLLDDVLGTDPSLGDLPERLAVRGAGNPLFLTEAVRALVADESLVGEMGAYRRVADQDLSEIPASVEALVAARIDRLGEREKAVLQAAAVIGEEFLDDVLQRVSGLSADQLEQALDVLQDVELLRPVDRGHVFRQTVVQEVAYHQQLERRRRALHSAAASALADVDGELDEGHLALIASHAERAGELVGSAEWHAQAARVAVEDPVREREHWRQVVRLLTAVPARDQWLDRLGLTARVRLLTLDWRLGSDPAESSALAREARELAVASGAPMELVVTLVGQAARLTRQGDLSGATALAVEATDVAQRAEDAGAEVVAGWLALPLALTGRLDEAERVLDRVERLLDEHPELTTGLTSTAVGRGLGWRAAVLAHRGEVEEARVLATRARQAAGAGGDALGSTWADLASALACALRGDAPAVRRHLDAARADLAGVDDPSTSGALAAQDVAALVAAGQAEAGLAAADAALAALAEQEDSVLTRIDLQAARGAARLLTGDLSGALADADAAVAAARAAGARLAELRALLVCAHVGAAEATPARLAEARSCVDRGLELVEATGARAWAPALHATAAALAELEGARARAAEERSAALATGAGRLIARPIWRPAPLGPAPLPPRRALGGQVSDAA